MSLISIEQALAHCKADSADETLIAVYLGAAEKAVANLCNRSLFVDATERAAAVTAAASSLVNAYETYDAAVAAADAEDDDRVRDMMLASAEADLSRAKSAADNAIHGIVVTDDLRGAILLMLGHLWANREDTVVGPSMAAIQLPNGAYNLAWPYRRLGSL